MKFVAPLVAALVLPPALAHAQSEVTIRIGIPTQPAAAGTIVSSDPRVPVIQAPPTTAYDSYPSVPPPAPVADSRFAGPMPYAGTAAYMPLPMIPALVLIYDARGVPYWFMMNVVLLAPFVVPTAGAPGAYTPGTVYR